MSVRSGARPAMAATPVDYAAGRAPSAAAPTNPAADRVASPATKVAVIFPGQGAQVPGMGLELAHAYPATAGVVFKTADRVLGFRLGRVVATGDQRVLSRTEVTQPALLAASLTCWLALKTELPGLRPAFGAGLSLGEYAALAAAEALDLPTAFRLISWRGRYMEDAARASLGGMSAIIGLERAAVEALCAEVRADESASPGPGPRPGPRPGPGTAPPTGDFGRVWVANYNAPGQTVVTGHRLAVAEVSRRAAAAGGRAVPLKVNGAYHSPLMAAARRQLAPVLATVPWRAPAFPVYANATGRLHGGPDGLARDLAAQVTSPVLWEDIVRDMAARGVGPYVELGPGKTLASLVARIVPGAVVYSVSDLASLAHAVEGLAGLGLGARAAGPTDASPASASPAGDASEVAS